MVVMNMMTYEYSYPLTWNAFHHRQARLRPYLHSILHDSTSVVGSGTSCELSQVILAHIVACSVADDGLGAAGVVAGAVAGPLGQEAVVL